MNEDLLSALQAAWETAGKPTDREGIIDALISAGFRDAREDRDAVVEFIDRNGAVVLDTGKAPEALAYEVFAEHTRRLRKADELQRAERIRGQAAQVRAIAEEVAGKSDAGIQDLRKPVDALGELIDGIRDVYEPPKTPLSPGDLLNFGAAHEIPVDFLNGLKLPSPGITVVGGKTGGGKTTALVNVTRSLLEEGLRCAVFSYEQTKQDLALLLALSIMAKDRAKPLSERPGYGPPERFEAPHDGHIVAEDEILEDYHTALKHHIQAHGIPEYLETTYKRVTDALVAGRLELWDYYGDARELADRIRRSDFDAYIVDYIQVIPPAPGNAREGYQRIADVAGEFRNLASAGEKTLILGAQFNRQAGESGDPNEYDPSMEQFREAADIEHLATLALGLGWYRTTDGEKAHYWKILKHRYNAAARDARMFSGGHFRYCYVQPWSRWKKPPDWPHAIEGSPAKMKKPDGNRGTITNKAKGTKTTDKNRAAIEKGDLL